jgi:hypothetical protein
MKMLELFGEMSGSYGGEFEDVFWDVAPCRLIEVTDVSEMLTASIIRAMSSYS